MANLNISKFFNNEAKSIVDARSKCIEIHGSDIRAAGNEVEIAVRCWLQRMLPDTVSVGHGHIIDSESNISPQLDCVLRDRSHIPTLFQTKDGTEYTPIDSVFSYGEIKSSYSKSSRYIQKFSENKKKIRESLSHVLIENTAKDGFSRDAQLRHILLGSTQPYLNQIFTFMLFIDAGDSTTEEIEEIYKSTDDPDLPDIVVMLNGCVIVKGALKDNKFRIFRFGNTDSDEAKWHILPFAKDASSEITKEGKHLGTLYYLLLNHIKESSLEGPDLTKYLGEILMGSKSSMIEI